MKRAVVRRRPHEGIHCAKLRAGLLAHHVLGVLIRPVGVEALCEGKRVGNRSVDECIGEVCTLNPTQLPLGYAACSSFAAPYRVSRALTLFTNAFSNTPLPMLPSTKPSKCPLKFLPSRTTVTSMSVIPSRRRVKV